MLRRSVYMKQPVKMLAYEEILQKAGVADSAVAYIGDDLPDIPLLRRAGWQLRWAMPCPR
jgi:3-deoxy-D-manno-octulosonate 8-phosphate phosphatase (KDO 8-P phosphatase)